MSDEQHFLITMANGPTLLRFAISFKAMPSDIADRFKYWAEPGHSDWIRSLLPDHIASVGPIVQVEELFDVVDKRTS